MTVIPLKDFHSRNFISWFPLKGRRRHNMIMLCQEEVVGICCVKKKAKRVSQHKQQKVQQENVLKPL